MAEIASERLYRTADGDVVREGHVDAAFLLAAPGDEIPEGFKVPSEKPEVKGPPVAEKPEPKTRRSVKKS